MVNEDTVQLAFIAVAGFLLWKVISGVGGFVSGIGSGVNDILAVPGNVVKGAGDLLP